jgi:hypothetical protein
MTFEIVPLALNLIGEHQKIEFRNWKGDEVSLYNLVSIISDEAAVMASKEEKYVTQTELGMMEEFRGEACRSVDELAHARSHFAQAIADIDGRSKTAELTPQERFDRIAALLRLARTQALLLAWGHDDGSKKLMKEELPASMIRLNDTEIAAAITDQGFFVNLEPMVRSRFALEVQPLRAIADRVNSPSGNFLRGIKIVDQRLCG